MHLCPFKSKYEGGWGSTFQTTGDIILSFQSHKKLKVLEIGKEEETERPSKAATQSKAAAERVTLTPFPLRHSLGSRGKKRKKRSHKVRIIKGEFQPAANRFGPRWQPPGNDRGLSWAMNTSGISFHWRLPIPSAPGIPPSVTGREEDLWRPTPPWGNRRVSHQDGTDN